LPTIFIRGRFHIIDGVTEEGGRFEIKFWWDNFLGSKSNENYKIKSFSISFPSQLIEESSV
jgi:hypothetical protein